MMSWYKRWASVVMTAVMMVSLVPAAQANELVPMVQKKGVSSAESPASPPDEVQPEFRNLALGLPYEWSGAPDPSHPDAGNKLTDGKYGQLDMNDPAWVGHVRGKAREVVFDLGEDKSIGKITAHFFQDYPANSILVPLTVSMYVSDDKENWGLLSHNATQLLWGEGPPRQEMFAWDGSRDGIQGGSADGKLAYARYVKVIFTMHPTQWEYIDEIEIMGMDGKIDGAVKVPADQPHFLEPGDATGGIRNLNLLYNGQYADGLGDWTKERIIPNISYVDQHGEPADWLFEGVLYLGLSSPAGRDFGLGQTNLGDWTWYLDKTFAAAGDMQQLNEATKEVGSKLNQPNYKEKVVLMIPNPGESLNDFGDVDGSGESLSFNDSVVGQEKALENREKAVQWWLDQVRQRWQAANYSNLELVGMYWLEEQISTSEVGPRLIKAVSGKVHDMNLKFFWIPHSLAYKSYMWKDVGFDAAALQPNYFFGGMDQDRLEDAADTAKRYGMSNEVEFDDRMLQDGVFRERYIDYLNSGAATGLMQKGFRAYYQGNNAVYNLAVSKDPGLRLMYDWLYQYLNGTYVIHNSTPSEADVFINGQKLNGDVVVPDTETVVFTWEVQDDDSGLTRVTATFDGKPYAPGTPIDLKGMPGKHQLAITVAAAKSKTTAYTIRAASTADTMKAHVNLFAEQKQFTTPGAPRSLNVQLDQMKRFEGKNAAQFDKFLKGFNAKLDQLYAEHIVSDTAYASLKEEVYDLAGNLAENKTATASSVEGSVSTLAPKYAVDGFSSTRWASSYVNDSWFQVDLGEAKTFDTVRIEWEFARAKTYKILVSDDQQNWRSVIQDNDSIITAHDGKETVQFAPVTARYVKFQGIERATDYGYSFYEFGIYNLSGSRE